MTAIRVCVVIAASMLAISVGLPSPASVAAIQAPLASDPVRYSYDPPSAATTHVINSRSDTARGEQPGAARSRWSALSFTFRRAAKGADEAIGGVYSLRDEAGNVVRTGRSKDLARREAEHARDPALSEFPLPAGVPDGRLRHAARA